MGFLDAGIYHSDQNNLYQTELGFTDRILQASPQQGFHIIPHMYQELQDLETKSLEKSNCSGKGVNMKKEEQEEDYCKTPTRSDQILPVITNICSPAPRKPKRSSSMPSRLRQFLSGEGSIGPSIRLTAETSIGSLHKKYSIGSYELLSKTAPIHSISLLMRSFELLSKMILFGPFLDCLLSARFIFTYKMTYGALLHFFLRLLLLSSFCLVGATSNFTIYSPDGDIIDCIDILSQPSFGLPIMRNHNFEETPTPFPGLEINNKDKLNWQIWHRNGTSCPERTIPKRRIVSGTNKTTTYSISAEEAHRGHEYAVGQTKYPQKIFGTKVNMNIWRPKLERDDEFSLGQVWLASGSYRSDDLNTIEAGSQVCPKLYFDYQPRFFVLWTSDGYHNNTCYNLRCGGFIQTSRNVLLEGAISPVSTCGGSQAVMTIQIWKDPESAVWWLGVGFGDTLITPVGYWPTEIFTLLTEYAEYAEWGGEIINRNISGKHTTTQMGSGYIPNTGEGAYVCDIEIATSVTRFEPNYELKLQMTNKNYYDIKKFNDTCFSYGGPEHAAVYSLKFHFFVPFFCFCIFLLF